jgi:hypothetical protein
VPEAPAVDVGLTWVSLERRQGLRIGDAVVFGDRAVRLGQTGVAPHGNDEVAVRLMGVEGVGDLKAGDARVLDLALLPGGRARRPWRDAVDMLTVLPVLDWPIPGPRTTEWCAKFLNRRAGGPTDWHRFWRSLYKLNKDDWGVTLHELAMRMFERFGVYDGLDVCNIAAIEDLMRQAQLVEHVYLQEGEPNAGKGKGKGKQIGLYDEGAIFAGTHRECGDAMVAPELLDYVSKEVERDASILKQVRNERRLLHPKKKDGKDAE